MTTTAPPSRRKLKRLSSPQVNLLLGVSLTISFVTGIGSWMIGDEATKWWTIVHSISGFTTLFLAPAKSRTSVRTGFRRGLPTRYASAAFGVLVLSAILFGFLHTSGIWFGVGTFSAFWIHLLAGFLALPLLIWHIWARPIFVKRIRMDRRMFLRGGMTAGLAAAAFGATEVAYRVTGLEGANRRFTGSHEIASGTPSDMPVVSWFDDVAPTTSRDSWRLEIAGVEQNLDQLASIATPVDAVLDCTGGWWSEQSWDAVPVSALLDSGARSFEVTSSTGFSRIFDMSVADDVYVAIGYGGEPLARGHGAPVRLVCPGRRGPWWVKWVVSIEPVEQPSWLQSPFPLT